MSENDFSIHISKDELAELPVVTFPGQIVLVDSAAVAHSALRALATEKAVGFDTETRPSFRKGSRHKVALMQLSTSERCFLFRLNKIGICAELKRFLENPDILKIGLSVHDDFNAIRRSEDFEPAGFIDLQSEVSAFKIKDISLQKIYGIVFGERISKGQRLTNWEADSLTEAQQGYAAIDAWACLRLYEHLRAGRFNPLQSSYLHRADEEEAASASDDTQNKS